MRLTRLPHTARPARNSSGSAPASLDGANSPAVFVGVLTAPVCHSLQARTYGTAQVPILTVAPSPPPAAGDGVPLDLAAHLVLD